MSSPGEDRSRSGSSSIELGTEARRTECRWIVCSLVVLLSGGAALWMLVFLHWGLYGVMGLVGIYLLLWGGVGFWIAQQDGAESNAGEE